MIGNWVAGDNFWDCDRELELFIEYLAEGAKLLLVAQRRIGKTSLMHEAARRIGQRYLCLHVDLQKASSPADAIVELSIATFSHGSLWRKARGVFANILNSIMGTTESLQLNEIKVTLRSGLTGGDWQTKGDSLFEVLAAAERPVVVFFDEVPILVNRMLKGDDYQITSERRQQTDVFMSWLRANSLKHQEKVRLVVTGSIGLEPVLRWTVFEKCLKCGRCLFADGQPINGRTVMVGVDVGKV